MKKQHRLVSVLLILSALLTGHRVFSQVKLTLQLNHKNYHQYEPIFAKVTFLNQSNRFISFSDSEMNKGKLVFLIKDAADNIIPLRRGTFPPTQGLILPNGVQKQMPYCITNYYQLNKRGKYRVKAILQHPQVAGKWESNTITFSIETGRTFYEQVVGVPDPDNKMKNQLRRYLIKTLFDGKDKIFYLIVEDDKYIYSVIRIGYDMGTTPSCSIDAMNRLHVMLQASPNVFSHFIYNYTGIRESKQVYYKSDISPRLVKDPKTGMIKVVGGKRALKDVHYKEEDPGTIFGE